MPLAGDADLPLEAR